MGFRRSPSLAPGGCAWCLLASCFGATAALSTIFGAGSTSGTDRTRRGRADGHKRRLRVVDNRLRRRIICRETIALDARRIYQPMETDRKYSIHAQTDRDCCCCRPKIMASRDGRTQEHTLPNTLQRGHLLSRAYGQIGSIGRFAPCPERATREADWLLLALDRRMVCNRLRVLRHFLAEGAGVEPARPEGLAALAVRCLAARPTLRR